MKNKLVFVENRVSPSLGSPTKRSLMELNVVAHHSHLKHTVSQMDNSTLLAYMHPLDREYIVIH